MKVMDIHVIAAYLNTSCCPPSNSRYEIEFETKLKDAQAVVQTIRDRIFPQPSIGHSMDASNKACPNIIVSKEGANKYKLLIEPLPLGKVALTTDRCSLTGASYVNSDWVHALALVPPALALRTLVANFGLKSGEMQETLGVVNCGPAEGFFETNSCVNVFTGISNRTKLLEGTFLECILSTPPGGTAELRIGVLDDPTIVVGVAMEEIDQWRVAVKAFAEKLFPAIPLSNVGFSLCEVNNELQGECVVLAVDEVDIPRLLKLFRGKVKFNASCSICVVTKNDLDHLQVPNDPRVDRDRKEDVEWIASNKTAPIDTIHFMERYLLVISVKVPDEYSVLGHFHLKMTSIFRHSNVPTKLSSLDHPFRIMQPGDIFTAWLRAKGLANGAIRANMLTSLLGSPIRILLCQENELARVQRSLYIYSGERVNVEFTVTESSPNTWAENLRKFPCRLPVVFICTWNSAALLNPTLQLIPVRMRTVKECLVLANIEDGLSIDDIRCRYCRISVVDVVLMEMESDAISDIGFSTGNPLFSVPMGKLEVANSNLRRELFDRWMHEPSPPPWELVQADVVLTSENVRKGLISIFNARKTERSCCSHAIIEKTAPGCGASCALRKMGHELQRCYGARCLFLNDRMECRKELINEYVRIALGSLESDPISWIVVLIDEHELRNDFVEAILAVRMPGKHITVISVQSVPVRGKATIVSIDPYLNIADTRAMAADMSTYLPDSRESIVQLVMHIENQGSLRCPERHIYVLMLTAHKREFQPVSIYLDQRMAAIQPGFERSLVYLLALLSRFSFNDSSRSVSLFQSRIDSLPPSAKDLLCDRGEKISFLHPLFADALLRLDLPEGESFCSHLASLTPHLNVMSNLNCTGVEMEKLCNTLMCERMECGRFSSLVQTLFDERAIHVLNMFLDIPTIKTYLKELFKKILLSRWMRCDNKLEDALAYAVEALRIAESELITHSSMARNNLGEVFAQISMREANAS